MDHGVPLILTMKGRFTPNVYVCFYVSGACKIPVYFTQKQTLVRMQMQTLRVNVALQSANLKRTALKFFIDNGREA